MEPDALRVVGYCGVRIVGAGHVDMNPLALTRSPETVAYDQSIARSTFECSNVSWLHMASAEDDFTLRSGRGPLLVLRFQLRAAGRLSLCSFGLLLASLPFGDLRVLAAVAAVSHDGNVCRLAAA